MEEQFLNIMLFITFLSLFVSLFKPLYGVIAYLIIFMCRFGEFYPLLAKIRFEFLVGVYVLLRMIMAGQGLYKMSPAFNQASKYLFIFLAVVFASVPFAFDITCALEWAIFYLKLTVFSLMALCLINTEKDLRKFVWFYVILTTWVAFVPFTEYLQEKFYVAQNVRRISAATSYFSNPNALANTVLQGLPFIFYGYLNEAKKNVKMLLLCCLGICTALVIMTGSRGGFLGLITFSGIIAYQSKNRRKALFLVSMAMFLLLFSMAKDYKDRYLTIFEFGNSDLSAKSRIIGLQHGISMMIRRPVLGVGIGCYPEARKAWYGWGLWAHNHYGQLFGELGIIGTVVWFLLLYHTFRNIGEAKRLLAKNNLQNHPLCSLSNAVQACLIIRLVVGMTVHSLYGFIWYICAALSVVSLNIIKKEVLPLKGAVEPTEIALDPKHNPKLA